MLKIIQQLIYWKVRFFARIGVWMMYRKVYVEDYHHVPAGKKVIYALNHPTAFIDPVALATHVHEHCWTMLRADMFVNATVRFLLHSIKNLPISRAREGDRVALKNNLRSLDFAADRALHGEPTTILSEGVCKHERRLRPIQRGTAQLLHKMWRKSSDPELAIVPVSIQFDEPNTMRSNIILRFGQPIYARDYAGGFEQDLRTTIEVITEEIHSRLRKMIIHVEDPRRDDLAASFLPLIQHEHPDRGIFPTSGSNPYWHQQWEAVEKLNALSEFEAGQLRLDLEEYQGKLKAKDVNDAGLVNPGYGNLGRGFLLWLLSIPAIIGWMINYPVWAMAWTQAQKRVKLDQFFASIVLGMAVGGSLVYMIIWMALAAFLVGWFALLLPVLMTMAGYAYMQWRDSFTLWGQSARAKSLSVEERADLLALRQNLLRKIGYSSRISS